MKKRELTHWWHALPALPDGRATHTYHALRRVWGDHTMAANRSFFNPRSEDHTTLSLFHTFSIFSHYTWVNQLLELLGQKSPPVRMARFAYACEETLDPQLREKHGRNFIIPDIILHWRTDSGDGLLAFEVKRPSGPSINEQDRTKLSSYSNLPSMRQIPTRLGCFLIDDRHKASIKHLGAKTIGWSDILNLQISALENEGLGQKLTETLKAHIRGHFARFGVGGAPIPPKTDLISWFERARNFSLPPTIESFVFGLAVTANWWAGGELIAPFGWLEKEPSCQEIRINKVQQTEDRRLNRWRFGWSIKQERTWPHEQRGTA